MHTAEKIIRDNLTKYILCTNEVKWTTVSPTPTHKFKLWYNKNQSWIYRLNKKKNCLISLRYHDFLRGREFRVHSKVHFFIRKDFAKVVDH